MLCHHGVKNPPARRTIGLDDPSSPGSSSSLPDPRSTQASYSKKVSVERGPVPSRPQQKKPSPSHSDFYDYKEECSGRQVGTRIDPCCGDPRAGHPARAFSSGPCRTQPRTGCVLTSAVFSVTGLDTRPFLP